MASTQYDDTLKNASNAGPSAGGESIDFNMDEQEAAYAQRAAAKRAAKRAGDGNGVLTVQPLRKSDMQVSYAQDFEVPNANHGFYGSLMNCLGVVAGSMGQLPCCFCCPNPFKEIQQGSVGLVSRYGQVLRAVDPGLVNINPCSESVRVVDIKIQLSVIPRQTVMTRDNVSVEIESVCYWHVENPYLAAYAVADVRQALIERAQTTLRDVVGARPLQSVVSDREGVAVQVEEIVENVSRAYGVRVESILVKDIIFSRELQESLSSAATQRRIGESKVIAARAEVDAAKLMRQAADILASPAAMNIRTLEAYQAMAKSANAKVIFVPTDMAVGGGNAAAGGSGLQNTAMLQQLADNR